MSAAIVLVVVLLLVVGLRLLAHLVSRAIDAYCGPTMDLAEETIRKLEKKQKNDSEET